MTRDEMITVLFNIAETTYEPPSTTFTYAMLAETARMVDLWAKRESYGGKELPNSVLEKWLYIAEEYFRLGHYLFALEYYGKAIEAVGDGLANGEKPQDRFIGAFAKMLTIFTRMGNQKEVDEFLAFLKQVAPNSLPAIQKPKPVFLETDPVEYTKEYIAILPELEAKIEAELIEESQHSDIYCFLYWNKKEEILKRDYGIEWESPDTLNPHVRFN